MFLFPWRNIVLSFHETHGTFVRSWNVFSPYVGEEEGGDGCTLRYPLSSAVEREFAKWRFFLRRIPARPTSKLREFLLLLPVRRAAFSRERNGRHEGNALFLPSHEGTEYLRNVSPGGREGVKKSVSYLKAKKYSQSHPQIQFEYTSRFSAIWYTVFIVLEEQYTRVL